MAIPILLAMQAAGMVVDYMGKSQQIAMGRIGTQMEQASINANIELTRAQSAEASVANMKSLRQTMGAQAAYMAARGTRSNAGSAAVLSSESIGNFNSDERTRRMNLLSREAELRAGNVMSGMHQLSSETQLGQSLSKRFFEGLPISGAFDKAGNISSGLKSVFGMTSTGQ